MPGKARAGGCPWHWGSWVPGWWRLFWKGCYPGSPLGLSWRDSAGSLVSWPLQYGKQIVLSLLCLFFGLGLTESLESEQGVRKCNISMPNSGPSDEEAGCVDIQVRDREWSIRGPISSSFHGLPRILKRVLRWQSDWWCNAWSVLKKKQTTKTSWCHWESCLAPLFSSTYCVKCCL